MGDLKTFRRYLYDLAPDLVGRAESVASLTASTVVVTALGTGGYGEQRFRDHWLLRAEAASSADRVRKVTSFASASGTLTHGGSAYSDTTATGEVVEILGPDYEPGIVDREINHVLGLLMRLDRTELAASATERYYLKDLSWLTSPDSIVAVRLRQSPVLTRNRSMEQWNTVTSAGVLQPDWWTLTGSGATLARATAGARRGPYTAAITRNGTNATLVQSAGLLHTGASSLPNSLAGQVVSAVAVAQSAVASQVRVTIDDGVSTYSSAYHTGGGAIEELTVTATLSQSATKCDIYVEVNGSNTVCYVDELYGLWGQVTDAVRRDRFEEATLNPRDYHFDQVSGALILPLAGWGRQYVILSKRPYTRFDATRLAGGSADGDSSDAPREVVAVGALWRIHEALGQARKDGALLALGEEWRGRYEALAEGHLAMPQDHDGGVPLPVGMLGGRPPGRG